jgi:hypothetical protein
MKTLANAILVAAMLLVCSLSSAALAKGAAARGQDVTYGSTTSHCVAGECTLRGKYRRGQGGNKTCTAYARNCAKRNPGSTQTCEAAAASCMQTGTFVGPKGRVFSGVIRN